MLRLFLFISILEGLSLIALLGFAVPLKYWFHQPQFVPYVGMAHGVLFLAYIVIATAASHQRQWSVPFWLLVLLCSVVPFSFILLDKKLKREQAGQA